MKLKDLFESTLVKGTDRIAAHVHMDGGVDFFRGGKWFQDHILDLMDLEIDSMKYLGGYWKVHLLGPEEDEDE